MNFEKEFIDILTITALVMYAILQGGEESRKALGNATVFSTDAGSAGNG